MEIMRSLMFLPANNPKFLSKAPTIPADVIVLDLEDSVALQQKQNARELAAKFLEEHQKDDLQIFIRVNPWISNLTDDDLEVVVQPGLNGIILPKTNGPEDVLRLEKKLVELEQKRGLPCGSVNICILIETALGAIRCYESCIASKRVRAVLFGAVDYCLDMHCKYTDSGEEQYYVRNMICQAAHAAGIPPIDSAFASYAKMEAYRKNTLDGIQMGFEGRIVIHPSQVPLANELYAPTEAEILHATRVKTVFEQEGLAHNLASISIDGAMVDMPVYIAACELLERAEKIAANASRFSRN